MADTVTSSYSFTKPEVGASEDSWGTKLNTNLDALDDLLDGTTVVTGISMDDTMSIVDNADNTKVAQFQLSGITTGTTRTFTFPDASGTVMLTDATITSIAALGTAADKGLYTTGVDTWAEFDLTAAGRALLDDADASAQRTTLGLGSSAVAALIDDDTMATATATNVPSAESVVAFTTNRSRFTEQLASGTNGAALSTGGYGTLSLNTTAENDLGITLSSDQLTFANAGTYRIRGWVGMYNTDGSSSQGAQIRLRNTTAGATEVVGQSAFMRANGGATVMIDGEFVVSASDVLELQADATSAAVINGVGNTTGEVEVFTSIIFERVA